MNTSINKKEIIVFAFNNCLTSSVIGILDVFEIANTFWKNQHNTDDNYFDVKLASTDGGTVKSFTSIPISPSISSIDILQADIIIVPPVMNQIDKALNENIDVINCLRKLHSNGSILISICTGIFFLGEAGVLNGKTVTTNPMLANTLIERYPKVTLELERVLIDSGDVITSGPTYAFLDIVIYLIENHCGTDIALKCSKLLLHDKNRTSQSPYFLSMFEHNHKDEGIKKVQLWIKDNYHSSLSIESLAENFNMSSRTLVRRFRVATGETPLVYIQRLRVEMAKKILETTSMNIDEVTYKVGYSDTKSFGRLFKRYTDLSPTEYRKRFSSRAL